MFEQIGQITKSDFKRIQNMKSYAHQLGRMKKFMGINKKELFELGDTAVSISEPKEFATYKYTHNGRTNYYLVVSILGDNLAFAWSLYPVAERELL